MSTRPDPRDAPAPVVTDVRSFEARLALANMVCCNRLVCQCEDNARAVMRALGARLRGILNGPDAGKNLAAFVQTLEGR